MPKAHNQSILRIDPTMHYRGEGKPGDKRAKKHCNLKATVLLIFYSSNTKSKCIASASNNFCITPDATFLMSHFNI